MKRGGTGLLALLLLVVTALVVGVQGMTESIYGEAPQLAEMVAAGELPPVEERLPTNPMLIQPVERVGVYGGTWRMGLVGAGDVSVIRSYAAYEGLLRWDSTWSRVIPNLAQSYEVNEDASEFTFHLREGLRWSDGVPFTVDDIMFWYEDMVDVEDLHSSVKSWWKVNDIPVVVEKIDQYTVKFIFAGPYGQFPYILADVKSDWISGRPMHYMKQFHIDYNPDGIEALIEEAGVENWVKLYKAKFNQYRNPERPTMNAWVLTDWYDGESTPVVMERNPYYWKIDTDFNQLPYIDRISFVVYSSNEELRQAALDGHIDAQHSHLSIAANYNDYVARMTEAGYGLHTLLNTSSNGLAIHFNLVHQDPVLRSVFSNKVFREALSHAINRAEVIDEIYGIDLSPRQPAPRMESPYYREGLATQYTEFNPSLANQLLDDAGYVQRDAEGYRLTPEGQRIEFTITAATHSGETLLSAAEMLSGYWRELGVVVHVSGVDKVEREALVQANLHDVVIGGSKGGIYVAMEPFVYMPYDKYNSYFAIPWVYWSQGIDLGEEPSPAAKTQMELYDQLKTSTSLDDIDELVHQILAIAEEEFYVMGICLSPDQYMLVGNDFHNVPPAMPFSWIWPTPAPTNPCQYFIDPQD